jgi:hypothetical protein
MRILFVGDLHGNTEAGVNAVNQAIVQEAEVIVQVGDFGYWPAFDHSQRFIEALERELVDNDVLLFFADGNHEDHRFLPQGDNLNLVAENIWHVPRGLDVELDDTRLLFFGGARSVDRYYREAGVTWFEEEMPTEEQFDRAMLTAQRNKIDIVVSHDCPVETGLRGVPWTLEPDIIADNRIMRGYLREILLTYRPRHWFCGHWHARRTIKHVHLDETITEIRILGHDGLEDPLQRTYLLDTEEGASDT